MSVLQKRMRDTALVSSSAAQDVSKRIESARAVVADLQAQREFVEADLRRLRGNAGQTDSSIRNLYARVMATAPPNSLPLVAPPGAGGTDSSDEDGKAASPTAAAAAAASSAVPSGAPAVSTGANCKYLMDLLAVVGDRITDLSAIVNEYPAWKVRGVV